MESRLKGAQLERVMERWLSKWKVMNHADDRKVILDTPRDKKRVGERGESGKTKVEEEGEREG